MPRVDRVCAEPYTTTYLRYMNKEAEQESMDEKQVPRATVMWYIQNSRNRHIILFSRKERCVYMVSIA